MTPMKWFFSFLKKYRGLMIIGILLTTAVSVLSVVNPYISGQIVDQVISGGKYDRLMPFIGCLIGVTIVMGVLRFLFQVAFETASQGVLYDMRDKVYRKLLEEDFAFSQRLSRAIGRMKKRETKMIMVSMKGGTVRINIANIYYIESQGHTLILHTILGDYETTGTMKEMEEKLADMNFCRGNKGYLINLAHVDGITDGCAMVKGERLVLSRARKKEFMEELTKYWGEVIK